MIDREVAIFFLAVTLVFAAFAGLVWWAARSDRAEYDRFMTECQADQRKEYECKAMWRAGNSTTVVVPVPINTGR